MKMLQKTHQQFAHWFLVTSILWLIASALLVVVSTTSGWVELSWVFWGYLLATLVASAIAFAVFGIDKRRAVKDQWRVSEKSMHWLALFGGWPGAVIGRELFRHKTQKMAFRLLLPFFAVLHMVLIFLGFLMF